MRNLVFLLLIASLVFGASIVKEFTFSEKNLTVKKVDGYDQIAMSKPLESQPNAAYFIYPTEEGKPLIPFYSISFLIPATAEIKGVTVLEAEKVIIPGEYYLYPTQRPIPISQGAPMSFVPPDNCIYSLATEYPNKRADIIKSGCKSGYRIAGVFLYPISYIPKEKSLFLYKRIKVKIDYQEGVYRPEMLTPSQKMLFSSDVKNLVINPEDVDRYSPPIRQCDDPDIDYIIITNSTLTTNFMPLVNWLRKTGIWADTISTNRISSDYSGRDLQEKIRNFIKDYFTNHGLKYVLLAGDNSIIPSRQARASVGSTTDDIPCDLYYADLQWSWDGNNNNIFGEQTVDTVDLYYDLYVGRASVENSTEVTTFINKLFTYEKNPDTTYQKRILLPWGELWSGYDASQSQDTIANYSPSGWTDRFIDNTQLTNEVRDSLNHGFGFCHMIGHGNETGVYWTSSGPAMYSTSHPPTQTNTDKLFIANSIACHSGNFEYSDCLAEEMIKASNCAVAVMLNSRYGWGYTGQIGPSELLDVRFYDFLFLRDTFRIAAAHQRSKEIYRNTAMSQQVWRWCYYELNLFGNPYMPMWTDYPQKLVASFTGTINTGSQNFPVTVTARGSPVSQATVALWKGSEVYTKGLTNASGQVTLAINPSISGYMYVTATAKNKIPSADSCQVTSVSHDVGVTQIVTPSGTIDSTASIIPQARVRNFGTNNETFNVTFKIGTGYAQTRSKTLSSGTEDTVNFPAWAPIRGNHTARCSTYLASDVNHSNDTLSGTFFIRVRNIRITQIGAPAGTIDSTASIIPFVRVRNYGNNQETFNVTFKIGTSYTQARAKTLSSGVEDTVNFPAWTSIRGTYITRCSTYLSGGNIDTLSGSVTIQVHDVGVTQIIIPAGVIDSGTVVTPQAMVKNFGTNTVSFPVTFRIGSFYANTLNVTNLIAGDSLITSFALCTLRLRGLQITKCSTALANDQRLANNALSDSILIGVHDVGIVGLLTPVSTVDSGTTVVPTVRVMNYGTFSENFPIIFSIGNFYNDTVVKHLDVGQSDTVSFTQWLAVQVGTHIIKCTTLLAGDIYPGDDYASDSVTVLTMLGFKESSLNEPLPKIFALANNLPNPFVARTLIKYSLPKECPVSLQVYNSFGVLVRTLKLGIEKTGFYRTFWNGDDEKGMQVAKGVYFYQLRAGEFTTTKKTLKLK
jgi:Peptidase family C25/FlgD Ig-like domain/Propeptide_C25